MGWASITQLGYLSPAAGTSCLPSVPPSQGYGRDWKMLRTWCRLRTDARYKQGELPEQLLPHLKPSQAQVSPSLPREDTVKGNTYKPERALTRTRPH